MKIAFLITNMNGGGGSERAVASLSNQLVTFGEEVTIIKLDNEAPFYDLDKRIKLINLNEAYHSKNVFERVRNTMRRIKKLRITFKEINVDVVVCMNISMLTFAILAKGRAKSKIIGTEQSNPYISLSGSLKKSLKKIMSYLCNGFIFQTEDASSFYPKKTQQKGIVIPNAIFDQEIYKLKIPGSRRKIITSVGRLIESKGFDVLIKAFNNLKDEFSNYNLEIYGEGPNRSKLEIMINNLNLKDRVFLKGQVKNVSNYIFDTSLFVFPSRHEGMPNALMEAMACGLPCISTDCRMGPRELINDGINGILVPVDDIPSMESAMRKIMSDKISADRIAANAIKIRETHSIDLITMKYINYFKEL
jgi:GalNAc-alpha-(1->4)-GalNAc-alpha-(1->3)-diNAcBac-PP-undecaprenol alpha-1,4-N-acetyl-D-galactosaminyltransferase